MCPCPPVSTLFPYTRRSSDLAASLKTAREQQPQASWTLRLEAMMAAAAGDWRIAESGLLELGGRSQAGLGRAMQSWRSEEHTSELQSLRHLVCRLLLEKKKKQ